MQPAEQNRLFEALGRIEANQTSLRAELLGPGGRITKIEEEQEKAENRQWLHTCVVVPIIGLAHAIAHYFGVKI